MSNSSWPSMDYNTPGFSVLHYLPEFAQLHVHSVSDAIQPFHPPLLLPSIFLSIRIFSNELGGQSIGASASVLLMNIQEWFPLRLTGLISLQPKWPSRVFSSTVVWKHQFFSVQPFLLSSSHIRTCLLGRSKLYGPLLSKWCLCFLICCLDIYA